MTHFHNLANTLFSCGGMLPATSSRISRLMYSIIRELLKIRNPCRGSDAPREQGKS